MAGIALFVLLLLVPTMLDYGKTYSIEGLWKNRLLIDCLCDSYNFWDIKDGKIIRYSDKHLTDWNVGEYKMIAEGEYRVSFPSSSPGISPVVWIVRPEKKKFYGPKDPSDHIFRAWMKRFRRIPMTTREKRMIKSAAARDNRIQKQQDEWEANQAAMQK